MSMLFPLEQRLALKALEKVEAESRAKGVTSETAGDIFLLLMQMYMQTADGAAIAQEFIEGRGTDELRQELIAQLGCIKSHLIYIGAVIDGKRL